MPAERLDGPGLGDWSMRDLLGHTSRSLLTVEAYLAAGAERVEIENPLGYFGAISGLTIGPAVTERGRQAGAALGDDPAAAIRTIVDRVLPLVKRTADETLVGTPWGGMTLGSYLPTRVFELGIHTLDITAALGMERPLPEVTFRVTWEVLGTLARHQSGETALLLAATGRRQLPSGFTVI